jgi:putative endonuclease
MNTYWVYIVASKPYGTLYIGVTNDLLGRVEAHRVGTGSKFTSRYRVGMLVHYEAFADIEEAIQREKTMKHWVRAWKINLIERDNPRWADLYPSLLALPGNKLG